MYFRLTIFLLTILVTFGCVNQKPQTPEREVSPKQEVKDLKREVNKADLVKQEVDKLKKRIQEANQKNKISRPLPSHTVDDEKKESDSTDDTVKDILEIGVIGAIDYIILR